jgi:hypothetical protein
MSKDYKPPHDANDVFTRYKALYEGERELKPTMREMAERELKAGATIGQLARLTGLTPEVFRRMARDLGVERKREPTVGKLSPTHTEPAAAAPSEQSRPSAPPARARRRREPEPRDGRPLTDDEAKILATTALERASEMQGQKLRQGAANAAKGYEDFAIVSMALNIDLLTHDEVYGPASSEETSG